MEKIKQEKSTLESRLFNIAMDWLSKVDRRDFYQQMVEFCANLLVSDVCALYVRTEQIDEKKRVCLVAGKLPPQHPKGLRMDPGEVGEEPKDHSYIVGELRTKNEEVTYDGITGRIATTGEAILIESQEQTER